jgi:class 3 adenylate cyclase
VFGDIRGFTRFASNHGMSEFTNLLNRYSGMVCRVVEDGGGMLNKFFGGRISGLFPHVRPAPGLVQECSKGGSAHPAGIRVTSPAVGTEAGAIPEVPERPV